MNKVKKVFISVLSFIGLFSIIIVLFSYVSEYEESQSYVNLSNQSGKKLTNVQLSWEGEFCEISEFENGSELKCKFSGLTKGESSFGLSYLHSELGKKEFPSVGYVTGDFELEYRIEIDSNGKPTISFQKITHNKALLPILHSQARLVGKA